MKLPLLSLLAAASLTLAACGANNDTDKANADTTTVTAPPADSAGADQRAGGAMSQPMAADPNGPTAPHADDKEFMLSAAHSDQNEIQLSKLALGKGVTGPVRDFANQMIADHTKSTAQLKPIAQQAGVTLPTDMDATHKAMVPMLEKLSGKAFEDKYLQQMVADHQKTANTLAAHQTMTKNSALQGWITATLPVVESHLSMAKKDEGMKM